MNDPDELVARANDLVRQGRIGEARAELDEAAALHRSTGHGVDEARCTQFAATLSRLDGDLDGAKARCLRVLTLCAATGPVAVAAHAELGEIALAEGSAAEAAAAFGAALNAAGVREDPDTAGARDPDAAAAFGVVRDLECARNPDDVAALETGADRAAACGALLRKRAVAYTAVERYPDAVHDLEAAHDLLVRAGDQGGAVRVLVETATALRHVGRNADAERVVERAETVAMRTADHAALADLHLLRASRALDLGGAAEAIRSAQTARHEALAANAPTSYISAAHTIAQLAELAGDRQAAYAALATGWATLGDLLGGDIARMSFAPKLGELRERWGAAAFADVKRSYEARRHHEGPNRATAPEHITPGAIRTTT